MTDCSGARVRWVARSLSILLTLSGVTSSAHAQGETAAPAPATATPAPTAPAPAATPANKPAAPVAKPAAKAVATSASAPMGDGAAEKEETELPLTPNETRLRDLKRAHEQLTELRKRNTSSTPKERELLVTQLREVTSAFRKDVVETVELLKGKDAKKEESQSGAKADDSKVEEEAKPADAKPTDAKTNDDAKTADDAKVEAAVPSEAEREQDAKNSLLAFTEKHSALELSLVRAEWARGDKLVLKIISELEKASAEDRPKLELERDDAIGFRVGQLFEWSSLLNARALLDKKVDQPKAQLEKALTGAAGLASSILHSVADELEKLSSSSDEVSEARKATLTEYRDVLSEHQRVLIELMDRYELDTTQLKQDLISTTGELSQDVLDADVARGLLHSWKDRAIEWVGERAPTFAFRTVVFLLILLLFWLLARVTRSLTRRALSRADVKVSSLAADFIVRTAGRIVLFIGLMVGASQFGIELGPLLAGLGIAGFVLGFALQSTLSNFASGMMILFFRPFDVGDVIEGAGVMGTVQTMNLVSTSIVTFDNQMLVVPNSKLWGDVIRNVTHQEERRVDLVFGIGYGDDLKHAERVLQSVVDDCDLVLDEPEPVIRLHELGDSSVNFVVRPWVKTEDYWDAYWYFTREVKLRFDAEGISIPFPQRDVHVYQEAPATATPKSPSPKNDAAE